MIAGFVEKQYSSHSQAALSECTVRELNRHAVIVLCNVDVAPDVPAIVITRTVSRQFSPSQDSIAVEVRCVSCPGFPQYTEADSTANAREETSNAARIVIAARINLFILSLRLAKTNLTLFAKSTQVHEIPFFRDSPDKATTAERINTATNSANLSLVAV